MICTLCGGGGVPVTTALALFLYHLHTGRDTEVGRVLQAALGLLISCLPSLTKSETSDIKASSELQELSAA